MTHKNYVLSSGLSALLALLLVSNSVIAEDEPEQFVDENGGFEEIVVTGSRLKRRDFTALSPIQSVDQQQLRRFDLRTGATRTLIWRYLTSRRRITWISASPIVSPTTLKRA